MNEINEIFPDVKIDLIKRISEKIKWNKSQNEKLRILNRQSIGKPQQLLESSGREIISNNKMGLSSMFFITSNFLYSQE